MSRLVAVLGYSNGSGHGLHAICSARLARAAEVVEPDDAVLFSGWARRGSSSSEAELMARAWTTPVRKALVDRTARSTAANAIGIARAARSLGADEVVLVTSSWHARRAGVLARAALAGSRATVRVITVDEPPRRSLRARELACWSLVPVLALVAARCR